MRDINFFESYIEKREFKIDRKLIYSALGLLIVLVVVALFILNAFTIRQEAAIVESLRQTAEDPKTLERVNYIQNKEVEVNEFRDSVEKIQQLDRTIESRDIVNESLLLDITDTMPEEVSLTSLSIRQGELNIVGMAQDKWSIAEFQKGLEYLNIHEEIFISNITLEDTHYNFSINMLLRGEDNNGPQ